MLACCNIIRCFYTGCIENNILVASRRMDVNHKNLVCFALIIVVVLMVSDTKEVEQVESSSGISVQHYPLPLPI